MHICRGSQPKPTSVSLLMATAFIRPLCQYGDWLQHDSNWAKATWLRVCASAAALFVEQTRRVCSRSDSFGCAAAAMSASLARTQRRSLSSCVNTRTVTSPFLAAPIKMWPLSSHLICRFVGPSSLKNKAYSWFVLCGTNTKLHAVQ